MPVGQMPVGGTTTVDKNTREIHMERPPLLCDQHNVRITVRHTGQNTN